MAKVASWRLAAVLPFLMQGVFAQGQALVWQSRFDPIVAPGVEYPGLYGAAKPASRLTAASDGELYFYALDRLGWPTVSRLRTDYSTVWRRSVRMGSAQRTVLDTFTLRDGGTLVVSGGLARFSRDGQLLWSRPLLTERSGAVLEYPNGDLAITDYRSGPPSSSSVLRVDGTTGAVIAGKRVAACAPRLLGVAGEALYVALCGGNVYQFDSHLSIVWQAPLRAASGVADTTGVYVRDGRDDGSWDLVKLASSNGAVLWRRSGLLNPADVDGEGHLLAYGSKGASARLESIDAATGDMRWSSAWDAVDLIVAPTSDGLYVAGSHAAGTSGFIERLDRLDGTSLWRTQLQIPSSGRPFLPRDVLLVDQGLFVVGSECTMATVCLTGLMHVDPAGGAHSAVAYPDVPQSVGVSATLDGKDGLVVASADGIGEQQHVRARQFEGYGATSWQAVFPVAGATWGLDSAAVLRRDDGGAFVTANTAGLRLPYLARHESNGATMWSRSLAQEGLSRGMVAFELDGAGDVVAGVGRITNLSGNLGTFVEKFGALDGQTRWSIPINWNLGGPLPAVHLVDDDLFLHRSSLASGIARYSGMTAGLQWSNPNLTGGTPNIFARSGNTGYMNAGKRVVAFSLSDGSALWDHDMEVGNQSNVWLTSITIAEDGDLYATGVSWAPSSQLGFVVRIDGQSGFEVWMQRFDAPVGAPALEANLRHVGDGEVWLTQTGDDRTFLTRLDASTGSVIDASLVDMAATRDETIAALGIRYGRRLSDGTILAYGSERQPGQPGVPWAGKLSAPNTGRHGNFSTRFDVTRARPGTERLSVRFRYDGPALVEDAIGYVQFGESAPGQFLPYLTGAQDVACIVSGGGTCLAVATPYGVRASLRLEPGAEAHLTADARTMGERVTAIAEVYAPYGFFENDLLDNRRSQPLGDRLFVDGFESL